jgi:hypothetical protein
MARYGVPTHYLSSSVTTAASVKDISNVFGQARTDLLRQTHKRRIFATQGASVGALVGTITMV